MTFGSPCSRADFRGGTMVAGGLSKTFVSVRDEVVNLDCFEV